ILERLQKDLSLKELPFIIECFDNSNFQGKAAVSSMVTFRNGKPDKKNYRIFNVKTVDGPDDFSTMKEVIYRRYKRVIEENKPKPNLIIVDGGKGQLSSAVESLKKLGIYGLIPIISIAKRLEEIYMPGDEFPVYIDKKSESLKLIQQLRDEAHRFGIKNHRQRLEKSVQATSMDTIKGIGEKTKILLLEKYKSISNIKKAPQEEIKHLIGESKTQKLLDQLNK
ncbi:MAG: excinuclease ABC subunit C, partial [Cytophagales bacterium]|nr:excinuclease ABC subunit C [Cytophagales bacterium]